MSEFMISIGICDDRESDLKQIETVLRENINRLTFPVSVGFQTFINGEDMLYAVQSGEQASFDLVFLDIEMPDPNGFLLARQIHMKYPETGIIFVSAHDSFVWESMEYSPLWFVRKNSLERDSFLALRKYLEAALQTEDFYAAGDRRYPLRTIMYIESMGHMLIFKQAKGNTFEQYGSLRALEAGLTERGFARIHKSYLVNLRYIEEIGRRNIRLTDGTLLEMGRDRRKSLCEAMYRYEEEHYGRL